MAHEIERTVQRRLAAHRRQQGVRALLGDDALQRGPVNGLDIRGIGHLRVRHDRRRIRINQDDPVALFAKRFARLRT